MSADRSAERRAQAFLGCLLQGDRPGAEAVVTAGRDAGLAPLALYRDVIGRALTDVGRLWALDELSIADEHMATHIATGVVDLLAPPRRTAEGPRHRALVARPSAETHVLGARVVGDLLVLRGWDVVVVAAGTPPDALLEVARALRPDLVALSLKLPEVLPEVRATVAALKALPAPSRVLVGGAALAHARCDLGADRADDELGSAMGWIDRTFPAALGGRRSLPRNLPGQEQTSQAPVLPATVPRTGTWGSNR